MKLCYLLLNKLTDWTKPNVTKVLCEIMMYECKLHYNKMNFNNHITCRIFMVRKLCICGSKEYIGNVYIVLRHSINESIERDLSLRKIQTFSMYINPVEYR